MRVEAWAVALRNAAAPGDVGIVHPLLRRYQGGAASMVVFGLPAVLVRAFDFHCVHLPALLVHAETLIVFGLPAVLVRGLTLNW